MLKNPPKTVIEWGISGSPFGKILLATSPQGIVQLSIFETDETESMEQLRHDWPNAKLIQNDRLTSEVANQIFKSKPSSRPKMDLRGTEFQLRVWRALEAIPRGKTTTYSQLAKHIGKPKAARAVGNAVGKNRIAYLIPCHRVIREDGTLGGYRWGTACKAKLLADEK